MGVASFCLLRPKVPVLVTQLSHTQLKATSIDYLIAFVEQEPRSNLAGWFWLGICQAKLLARAAVSET